MQSNVSFRWSHSRVRTPELAWTLWSIAIVLAVLALPLRVLNYDSVFGELSGAVWWSELIWWNILIPLGGLSFATTGALVAASRPENRVGWLALSLGIIASVQDIVWNYSVYTLIDHPGALPGGTLMGLLANLAPPAVVLLLFSVVLLLFPTGQPTSRAWRIGLWVALVLLAVHTAAGLFGSHIGLIVDSPAENPLALGPIAAPAALIHGTLQYIAPVVLAVAIASTLIRHKRMRGIERQQMKWVSYVGGIVGLSLILGVVVLFTTGFTYIFLAICSVFVGSISIGIPVAIGVAILRYRLYDIDVVINRTLVYVTVMLVLGAVYIVSVVTLQALIGSFAGSSSIAVAASTLLAVALFQPLRTTIQRWVDRRFYRTKYDAAELLNRFSHSIRDEVDLDRLQVVMAQMIDTAVRPSRMTVWMVASDAQRAGHRPVPSPGGTDGGRPR